MRDREEVFDTLGRAGKRALIHLLQAAIEGVKAVEAVIDEIGSMSQNENEEPKEATQRIDVE